MSPAFLSGKHLLSQWNWGFCSTISHTNLLQPVMNLLLFFYLILHSVKHRHYVFLASKINTYISEWQIQCSSHVEVFVAYYGSDCLTCPYGFFKQIMLGNGTVLCPFEQRCRGKLWEVSPWTDKSSELSLCLSCRCNLECIIKGEVNGRVLVSVFLKSCKSCGFITTWLGDLTSPFWFLLALSLQSHSLSL